MQALIDFDGWRKWKDFASQSDTTDAAAKLSSSYSSIAPKSKSNTGLSPTVAANISEGRNSSAANGSVSTPKPKDEERKNKRRSMGMIPPPPLPEEDGPTPDGGSA
jgi:osomolarity two-component system, response regulator SSK1